LSYGVLLWEIFTFGKTPYPFITTFQELRELIEKGERLKKPAMYSNDM
jgi:Protein tyrosine and serine/threonine kinase